MTRAFIALGIGVIVLLALCKIVLLAWGDCFDSQETCAAVEATNAARANVILLVVLINAVVSIVTAWRDRPVWHAVLALVAGTSLALEIAGGAGVLASWNPGSNAILPGLIPTLLLLVAPGPLILMGAAGLGLRRTLRR